MTAGGFLRVGLGEGGAAETLRVFLGADGTVVEPPEFRQSFNLRPGAFRKRFYLHVAPRSDSMSSMQRFDSVFKDPEDNGYSVELNLYDLIASRWKGNRDFVTDEVTLPFGLPTGFSYKASSPGGRSGSQEPRWPREIGATTRDGSVIWVCQAAGVVGLSSVTGIAAESDPAGITISGLAVSNLGELVATYSGGVVDEDYDVIFSFTVNGNSLKARQTVKVRDR